MKDEGKTKEQLINELLELRRRVTELEALETERQVAEEALARERNLLRTLIDNVPDYIYAMDTEGRFVLANITIAHYLGAASPDELLGKTDFDFYPPELAARHHALDQEIMQSGQPLVNLEESFMDLAGNQAWGLTNAIPLRDSQGKVVGLVGITWDITERKRTEKALQASEERFRLAFENANIGMCLVDMEGRLTKVNSMMCEIFGYSREELERMTVNDIAHPEDVNISPTFIRRASSGEITHSRFEKRYFHKQGHMVWGQVSSSLVRDAQGAPLYFISHVQDITERKRAEEEIKNLAKFPSENPNPVLRLDHDGLVLYANEASQALLEDWGCEVGSRAPTFWRDVVTEALTSRSAKTVDIQYGERVCSFFVAPITGAGYVNLYGRDITERKQVEEDRERLIAELQETLAKVKTLSGLLPICASCKKIRDDEGYWHQVEVYIRDHADVEFSHGICPDCLKKLYPDYV